VKIDLAIWYSLRIKRIFFEEEEDRYLTSPSFIHFSSS